MKNFFLPLIVSGSIFATGLCAITKTTSFISAEGFTEGGELAGTDGWLGQAPWKTEDVAGDGYATNATNFNRAVLWSSDTFNVGDSFTLVSVLSLEDSLSINTKTDMFKFGLTNNFDAGANGNTAKVGMVVRPAWGNYFIKAVNGTDDIDTNLGKDTLIQHTYKTVITKSATVNNFEISIDFDSGFASATYTIVDATLYAATHLYPIIDSSQSNDKGGIRLNSFSSTYTPVPEPTNVGLLFGVLATAFVGLRQLKAKGW